MLELLCATSNKHKLLEFQKASGPDVLVRGCEARDCPETGSSFEENALQKALCYSRWSESEWLFADDSGLEVDALGGGTGHPVGSVRRTGQQRPRKQSPAPEKAGECAGPPTIPPASSAQLPSCTMGPSPGHFAVKPRG